jgi:hypothetical protein
VSGRPVTFVGEQMAAVVTGAEPVEPAAVLLPTPSGPVKIDVLQVRQVELDRPSDDPGDRLHASAHSWAYDTATELTLEVIRPPAATLTVTTPVAEPGPLIAMKLQAVMTDPPASRAPTCSTSSGSSSTPRPAGRPDPDPRRGRRDRARHGPARRPVVPAQPAPGATMDQRSWRIRDHHRRPHPRRRTPRRRPQPTLTIAERQPNVGRNLGQGSRLIPTGSRPEPVAAGQPRSTPYSVVAGQG